MPNFFLFDEERYCSNKNRVVLAIVLISIFDIDVSFLWNGFKFLVLGRTKYFGNARVCNLCFEMKKRKFSLVSLYDSMSQSFVNSCANYLFYFFRFTFIAHHVFFTLGKAEWKEIVNLARKYLMLTNVPRTVIIFYIFPWNVKLKTCLVRTNWSNIW